MSEIVLTEAGTPSKASAPQDVSGYCPAARFPQRGWYHWKRKIRQEWAVLGNDQVAVQLISIGTRWGCVEHEHLSASL